VLDAIGSWTTSHGRRLIRAADAGRWDGDVSRSFCTIRPGSERNGHWAPTEARNSCSVWCSSVAIVAICVYATVNFG
jgi:hypothetical protein